MPLASVSRATRRVVVTSLLLTFGLLPAALGTALADEVPANISRAAAWAIGSKLALAAIGYAQGNDPSARLQEVRSIADQIGVTVADFPPRAGTTVEDTAKMIQYMLSGDGWSTGAQINARFGNDHGILFEIAAKSFIVALLYDPSGQSDEMARVIESRCLESGLPAELWRPAVDGMLNHAPRDTVANAVADMHDAVPRFLFGS